MGLSSRPLICVHVVLPARDKILKITCLAQHIESTRFLTYIQELAKVTLTPALSWDEKLGTSIGEADQNRLSNFTNQDPRNLDSIYQYGSYAKRKRIVIASES